MIFVQINAYVNTIGQDPFSDVLVPGNIVLAYSLDYSQDLRALIRIIIFFTVRMLRCLAQIIIINNPNNKYELT